MFHNIYSFLLANALPFIDFLFRIVFAPSYEKRLPSENMIRFYGDCNQILQKC